MSPFLERPLRPRHVVIADILANMSDTYIVVDLAMGEPYLRETDLGQSFDRVVRDILAGLYDCKNGKTGIVEGPVAVLRMSRSEPAENVTEKVAEAVLDHLIRNDHLLYEDEGYLIDNAFLSNVMPDWISRLPRGSGKVDPPEYEPEEAA